VVIFLPFWDVLAVIWPFPDFFSYFLFFDNQLFHFKAKGTIFFSKIFKGLNIRL